MKGNAIIDGVVFIRDENDSDTGSPAHGCLKLAWDNGSCQAQWCGHKWTG